MFLPVEVGDRVGRCGQQFHAIIAGCSRDRATKRGKFLQVISWVWIRQTAVPMSTCLRRNSGTVLLDFAVVGCPNSLRLTRLLYPGRQAALDRIDNIHRSIRPKFRRRPLSYRKLVISTRRPSVATFARHQHPPPRPHCLLCNCASKPPASNPASRWPRWVSNQSGGDAWKVRHRIVNRPISIACLYVACPVLISGHPPFTSSDRHSVVG